MSRFDIHRIATYGCEDAEAVLPLICLCIDAEDLKMYPVIPMEMNQFAADSLLYLFAAASALLSVVYGLK